MTKKKTIKSKDIPQKSKSKKIRLGFLVILIAIIGSAYLVRQRIYDAIRLYNYHPPAPIALLAREDTMNAYTTKVFYVNHPKLISTVQAFRRACPIDKQNIVLGCYYVGQRGIFIFNVNDPALAGVQQVTAAHEVLHAIYARLSNKARNQLDQELNAYYKHGLTNSRVQAEVKIYQKTEPGSVYDEMSCTFGTEIANLPPALNKYYQQFFNNRMAIVNYEKQYQAAFTSRKNQIKADDQQLAIMKKSIDALQLALTTQLNQINAQRAQLQSTPPQNNANYNRKVIVFNENVSGFNLEVNRLKAKIASYNQLVIARNKIAGTFDSLVQAINTKISPQQP